MFAADNPLSTYLSRSQVHPAYRSFAHEKRWFEVPHEVGIALSSNYSQFINDVAHAPLIASMLVFFYFDRGIFFLKGRVAMMTLKGRGLVSPRPLVTYLQLLVWFIRVIWVAGWALCRLICELTNLR